jgi:protein SCO1/2
MRRIPQTVQGLVASIFLLGLVGTSGVYLWTLFNSSWKGPDHELPIYSQLPDFTLTNQMGQVVTLATLHGHPWVVDVIFTRCAGPCPKMSAQMSRLQAALPRDAKARLISLTADPEHDTPAVLQRYSDRFAGQPARWLFLTGDRKQIELVAVQGLKLVTLEASEEAQKQGEDLFIHSTKLVLIDQTGQVRGYYDGTAPESQKRVLHDLAALLKQSDSI